MIRFQILRIPLEALEGLLSGKVKMCSELPADAKIVSSYSEPETHSIGVIVGSETFDRRAIGEHIRVLGNGFTSVLEERKSEEVPLKAHAALDAQYKAVMAALGLGHVQDWGEELIAVQAFRQKLDGMSTQRQGYHDKALKLGRIVDGVRKLVEIDDEA